MLNKANGVLSPRTCGAAGVITGMLTQAVAVAGFAAAERGFLWAVAGVLPGLGTSTVDPMLLAAVGDVQLSVLAVPSPAVTPTNLLFNVVAGPGARLRYRRNGAAPTRLTR